MRRKAVMVVLILAVALPACAPKRARMRYKERPAPAIYDLTIFLYPRNPSEPVPNQCDVSVSPPYLGVGRNDKLTWNIINLCGNTQPIEVKDFVGIHNPNHRDPLESDQGGEDPAKKLKFKVKANADYDVYKYRVYRGGAVAVDPEIDVER